MRAVALLILGACAQGEAPPTTPEAVDPVAELEAPGPWAVGYAEGTASYVDPIREEARALRLAWWFPTEATDGEPVRYQGIFDAPGVLGGVAPASGRFPVAVFSHGHQGYAENSSFLMAHFASHGFVVVAPEHLGNTTFDGPDRVTDIYWQRPLDVSATLDQLLDDPIVGKHVDPSVIVALGHSFGGYTLHALAGATYDMDALEPGCAEGSGPEPFCSELTAESAGLFRAGLADPRITAFVSMAPGDFDKFGASGLSTVDRPVLHMTGGLDPSGIDNERIWEALSAGDEALRVHLPGGGHQTFTDYSGILEDFDGLVDPGEGFRIVDVYALAFARYHLGEAAYGPILDGSAPVSEAATLY